jgi:TIR domain
MSVRSVNVFLSYASEQKDVARSIEIALRGEGHTVFLDRSALEAGETYNDQIREAIAASDLFVFLITPEALAAGRYTLTELELAERQWPSPSGHLLPVTVRSTPIAAIPPYLKGVTILEPQGNVAAEVAAAVARLGRPWWKRLIRPLAIPLIGAAILAIAYASWLGYQHWLTGREVSTLLEAGRLRHQSGDYSAAWTTLERARAMAPARRDVEALQEQLAMDWLDRIRVTSGQGTFTAIVLKVQPVLARCAVSKDARRAADCLAHQGWGDFLRTREGAGGLDPVQYYRRAIESDPRNVYGHAMWGFDLLRSRGSSAQAKEHFAKALGSGREREYVRHLEIAGWLWRGDDSSDEQVIRIANEIRLNRETMPAGDASRSDTWRLWDVYYRRLFSRHQPAEFLSALPAADQLTTFRWLFPENAVPQEKRNAYLFMRGTLEEYAGERAEALTTFKALRSAMDRDGRAASPGPLSERTAEAIGRLSKPR